MGRNNRALISGLFVVLLLAATTAVVYWLGHLDRERDAYFVTTQATVIGLNPESTVFYRGIAVGKVLNIRFDPANAGIILVKIEVDKNIVFTKGAFATLQLKGVTGLTQIEIEDTGKIPDKLVPNSKEVANRIPLLPSVTDRLLDSGDELLKKADHLMVRLTSLLNEENEKKIVDILSNLSTLSAKLNSLEKSVDKALAGIPALTADARATLKQIDGLSKDLQILSKEAKTLGTKVSSLTDTGSMAGNQLVQSTIPKVNRLLTELQTTTEQVKRIANSLENSPQSILLGPEQQAPGPGEPGYEAPE